MMLTRFVNTVFEDLSGIARGEIIGREGRRIYERAEDSALFEAFRLKALDGPEPRRVLLTDKGRRRIAGGG
jgi:hypothetical protein